MTNLLKFFAVITTCFVAGYVIAGPVPNSWYRSGNVDIQGILYTGTADTQLTNADGTLSAAAIASSCVNLTTDQTAAGIKTWSNAAVFKSTLGASGAVTLASTLTDLGAADFQSTLGATGAVTFASTLSSGSITTSGVFKYNSVTTGITAHSGGGQGSGTALTTGVNNITTVAAGADSVVLPTAATGLHVIVINSAASNTASLFPAGSSTINGGSASAAVSVLSKGGADCYAVSTSAWACQVAGAAVFP